MPLLVIVLLSAAVLLAAYRLYGPLLSRLLRLRDDVPTPAVALQDDVDYVPIDSKFLLSQHFSAIAAAGPIVGPIVAGAMFGWLPALLWILIGSILIGGVHDMAALVASIRHKARSIAEVVRDHMSRRAYLLFLAFVWIALVYIVVAFTDITASSFNGEQVLENGQVVTGGAIATSSLLYLALPLAMGLLLRYTKLSLNAATAIFLPLVGVAIWAGQFAPFGVDDMLGAKDVRPKLVEARGKVEQALSAEQAATLKKAVPGDLGIARLATVAVPTDPLAQSLKLTDPQRTEIAAIVRPAALEYNAVIASSQRLWNMALLVYCVVASVIPMWLLLQPRGHLGGYFLYFALGGGMLGLIFSGGNVQYPYFTSWVVDKGRGLQPLFPLLFITIACGACSGFHSIIASGTTSKQLRKEGDARLIGYGSMLLEAMVAVVSLCCVMRLAAGDALLGKGPNFLYASGIGSFLGTLGIPVAFGVTFGLMAFTTFVYDTLDVCTRLGRYIFQELTGLSGTGGRVIATAVTAGVPAIFLLWQPVNEYGLIVERWRIFWDLFGASNQLLAALTLIGVTVWLWRTYKARWVLLVTGLPCVWMYTMSMWALVRFVGPLVKGIGTAWASTKGGFGWEGLRQFFSAMASNPSLSQTPVPWVAVVLAVLGVLILVEAIRVMVQSPSDSPPPAPEGAAVAA